MIGNYRRVSSHALSQLIAGSSVSDFLYRDGDQEQDDTRELCIDKSWHAIHFLLTGSDWDGDEPLVHAVMGGEDLGDEDVGYGPARYLTPELVRTVANALEEIAVAELLARYDANRMTEEDIYPGIWDEEESTVKDYIGHFYEALVSFFRTAADAGDGMLIYLN